MNKELKIEIPKKAFNDKYLPLLTINTRFVIVYGGGSSGKSYGISENYIIQLLQRRCNLIVARKVGDTNRKSTFALFKQIINKWGLRDKVFKINESDMRIRNIINKNEVAFCGLDDVEKLKSITFESGECTDIWIEEATECLESDINQLIIRQRGGQSKKQMILSFNPVDVNHWIKKRFIDGKDKVRTTLIHSTYKDNRFLTKEDIADLESFKDTDTYYYDVYCLGKWGILGKTYFDSRNIQNRLDKIKDPIKVGFFIYKYSENNIYDIKWIDNPAGYIKIYEDPIKGHPYVIGGDTAGGEGNAFSDFFTGQVLDNSNMNQVAVLKEKLEEDEYARQMYCFGMYYNEALIGPEINYSTYPTKKLKEYDYPNIYLRETEDKIAEDIQDKYGFKTTKITRPIILAELVEIFRDYIECINDKETLEEALTFVRNTKGRPEAQSGTHDDLIMALAIAYYIRTQQRYSVEKQKEESKVSLPYELKSDEENENSIVMEWI